MPKLFISQEWVDHANMNDAISLSGPMLTVKADGKTYQVVQAVHFIKVEGGDPDLNGLVGKVKAMDQVEAMGAEIMAESAIVGENAYRVQPGYRATFTGAGDPVSVGFR